VVAALRARVPVEPVAVTDLSEVDAGTVVVAAGCATAALTGLPIRPVKGQILRLRPTGAVTSPLRHVVRGYADGRQVYLVPRADGEVVAGATEEEAADRRVTAGAVHDLLRAAITLVPELAEYELAEAVAGHRPGTPDNAPVIGRLRDGVVVASGHHRHGILLAPVTADLVAGIVAGADGPHEWTPGRFACE
jgi:glycine oxidase